MSKFSGMIGFATSKEDSPGVWIDEISEKKYYGDILRNSRKIQSSNQVNSDITISNEVSIVADPYLKHNFHSIRYVSFMGTKWTVTDAREEFPRLLLTLGGVYNG